MTQCNNQIFFYAQEQPDNQKLDDDEDRKNPAFIPRQGAFYEHDLRLGEDGLEEEDEK